MMNGHRYRWDGPLLMAVAFLACLILCQGRLAKGLEQVDVAKWYDFTVRKSAPKWFEGPFRCNAAAFYFVHYGGPLRVTVTLERTAPDPMDAMLVRFSDADEKLVDWHYKTYWSGEPRTQTIRMRCAADKPGVYTLRVVTRGEFLIHIATEPQTSFGILPMRTQLRATKPDQFSDAYVYVPPRSEKLVLKTYGLVEGSLKDENGQELLVFGRADRQEVTVRKTDVTWKLDISMNSEGAHLMHCGFPMIVCPDEATARNIRGSVEFAPDGTLLYHKYQVAMWEWMRTLKADDLSAEPRPLAALEKEWLTPPLPPKVHLLGSYGAMWHVAHIITGQNLDPKSIWYGSLDLWKDYEPKGVEGRWDREVAYDHPTLNRNGWPNILAIAYWLDEPFNPYRKDVCVRNRAVLAACADLLHVHEDGTLKSGNDQDMNPYSTSTGFPFAHNYAVPYWLVSKDMPKDVHDLWNEGMRQIADRYPFHRVSCENQSSHWPIAQYMLYIGSGIEGYKRMAHDFIVGMEDPRYNRFMKTGYQQEAYGPDSTYQGLGACMQAAYYHLSGDKTAKEGLRTIYNFFNHTVAPEPDGYIWGANNFCHRTRHAWQHPQYGGGLLMMAGELPEAGVWRTNRDLKNPELIEKAAESIRKLILKSPDSGWYRRHPTCAGGSVNAGNFYRYLFYPKRILHGVLPVLQSERFDRNFNDEFIAIRRPSYYALTYVGRTAHEWTKSRRKTARDAPYRRSGGGLSLFWTPGYGNCIVSMNYSALANHMVRADVEGTVAWQYKYEKNVSPKCLWPDYFALEHTYDPKKHALVATTGMVDLPIALSRTTIYEEDGVRQEVELNFDGDVRVKRLVENIPLLENKDGLRYRFEHEQGGWRDEPGERCRAAWVGDGGGDGVLFAFEQPVSLALGEDANQKWYSETQRMKPLEVDLGAQHKAGEHVVLRYRISATQREDSARFFE